MFFLSLHKIGCTRQFENKFSLCSFALSLQIRNLPKLNNDQTLKGYERNNRYGLYGNSLEWLCS